MPELEHGKRMVRLGSVGEEPQTLCLLLWGGVLCENHIIYLSREETSKEREREKCAQEDSTESVKSRAACRMEMGYSTGLSSYGSVCARSAFACACVCDLNETG
jgi:hypothetical protein